MTFNIVRSPEFYQHHIVSVADVQKLGIKKACIIGNVCNLGNVSYEDFHTYFPYIEKEEFYILFKELIADGHLNLKAQK